MRMQPFMRRSPDRIPESEKSTRSKGLFRAIGRLLLMLALIGLHGMHPAHAADTPPAVRPDLLYHNYCSVCHGDRGDGRSRARGSLVPPPKDFTSPQALADLTRDKMIVATAAGKPGTAMVGWSTQLGPREIEAVVDYVIDTFMKPRASASFETGRTIYARTCATCHGADGQGGSMPNGTIARSFANPRTRNELARERMVAAVTHGLPGSAMAGFATQLSGAEIGAVVDYIRAALIGASPADASGTSAHRGRGDVHAQVPGAAVHGGGIARETVKADLGLPLPLQLVGNPSRGRRFYVENCATCHGVKGDAQGPRAYFIRPKPRNFLSEESRAMFNRPALFAGISMGRIGSEMPAWSKVISEQQIADVAEYVFQSFIQPGMPSTAAMVKPGRASEAPATGKH